MALGDAEAGAEATEESGTPEFAPESQMVSQSSDPCRPRM